MTKLTKKPKKHDINKIKIEKILNVNVLFLILYSPTSFYNLNILNYK